MKKRTVWLSVIFVLFAAVVIYAATTQEDFEVTWEKPDKNSDGSPLTDLGGYLLCMKIGSPIPDTVQIADLATECTANFNIADTEEQTVQAITLTLGVEDVLYVRMVAYDTSGNMSIWSDEASTPFDKKSPAKLVGVKLIRKSKPIPVP